MDAKIISIGNSKGVRIPKTLLRPAQLDPSRPVQLKAQRHAIVIEQRSHPRAGREESFKLKRPRKPENLWGELPLRPLFAASRATRCRQRPPANG